MNPVASHLIWNLFIKTLGRTAILDTTVLDHIAKLVGRIYSVQYAYIRGELPGMLSAPADELQLHWYVYGLTISEAKIFSREVCLPSVMVNHRC